MHLSKAPQFESNLYNPDFLGLSYIAPLQPESRKTERPIILIVLFQGTLGIRNERIIRTLLEMLELDPSEYIRILVRKKASLSKLLSQFPQNWSETFDHPLT